MISCPNCKQQIAESSNFCIYCGNRLAASAEFGGPTPPPQDFSRPPEYPTNNTYFPPNPTQKGPNPVMITILILGICGLLFCGFLFIAMNGSSFRFDSLNSEPIPAFLSGELDNLAENVEQFRADVGRYPTNEEGLKALAVAPKGIKNWKGPYDDYNIDSTLIEGKKAIVYKNPGNAGPNTYSIIYYGLDQKPGGSDANADISVTRTKR